MLNNTKQLGGYYYRVPVVCASIFTIPGYRRSLAHLKTLVSRPLFLRLYQKNVFCSPETFWSPMGLFTGPRVEGAGTQRPYILLPTSPAIFRKHILCHQGSQGTLPTVACDCLGFVDRLGLNKLKPADNFVDLCRL